MEIKPSNFICRFCKGSFSQVQQLHRHVLQVHTPNHYSSKSSRTCPICGLLFGIGGKNENYRTHLRHIHGQREEGQAFAFKCFNDFFLWKTALERRTSCKYVLQSAPKVLPTNEKIHVYQCDQAAQSNKKRKFNVSNISDSKCPAMICATESMKNLEIKVDYWNTHVGHSVQVEEDELNAAISSVQNENAHAQVMDMLNSIGQGIETGAEVFVTETDDDVISSNPSSRNKMSSPRKSKSSRVTLPQTSQFIPNFSFKKDPSKKKESSIYSLASVACGKVSANKVNINKSASAQFQDLVKSIAKRNSGTIINSRFIAPSNRKEADKANDSSNNRSCDVDIDRDRSKQTATSNHPTSIGGKFVPITPKAQDESLPVELNNASEVSSSENQSETLPGKSTSDKENFSLTSNKIDESVKKAAPRSLLRTNSKNTENPTKSTIGAKNRMLEQSIKPPGIILTSVPVPQQNLRPFIGAKNSLLQPGPFPLSAIAQSSPLTPKIASPVTQTFISIDNKLIPVVNTPGSVLNPNLSPGIILSPALPQLTSNQIAPVSLPASTHSFSPGGLFTANKPLLAGTNEKVTSSVVVQNVPSLTTSFPSAPVVLIPYSSNSSIPSVLPSKPPLSVSSPLVLQTVGPMTSLPARSILSTSSVSSSPGNLNLTPLKKPVSVVKKLSTTSSPTTFIDSENSLSSADELPTTATNAVKILKSSLPVTKSSSSATPNTNILTDSQSVLPKSSSVKSDGLKSTTISSTLNATNKLTDSKSLLSQHSAVTSASINSTPVTSTPDLDFSQILSQPSSVKHTSSDATSVTSAPNISISKILSQSSSVKTTSTKSTPVTSAPNTGISKILSQSSLVKSTSTSSTPVTSVTDISASKVLSQPSSVNPSPVNLIFPPVTSAPNLNNISKIVESKIHKPGTFVFESAGELYMLEPLDDDLVIKSATPLTSTPNKKSEILKPVVDSTPKIAPSAPKRKCSPYDMKIKRLKENTPEEFSLSSTAAKRLKENTLEEFGISSTPAKRLEENTPEEFVIPSTPAAYAVYNASTRSARVVNKFAEDNIDGNSNSCASDISVSSHNDTDVTKSKTENHLCSTDTKQLPVSFSSKGEASRTTHSPFVNLFPTKHSTPSILTVKTVPSFSIHQSRPVQSFINSTRSPSSSLTLTSSNPICISSVQSVDHSVEGKISPDENNIISSEATTGEEYAEKQSEAKRVTIKSVAQEKRCVSNDDLEIMKKVKFYKLEMKYYSCQEECKKLKIELAKALSKNKELMEIIEDLKKNENYTKVIEKEPSAEERIAQNDKKIVNDDGNSDVSSVSKNDLIEHSVEDKSSPDTGVVSDINDITLDNEIMDMSNESSRGDKETASVSNITDITSDKEIVDIAVKKSDVEKESPSVPDTVAIPTATDSALDKEMIDISDESSDADKTVVSVQDTMVRPNTSDKEMIDVSEESRDGCKEIVSVPDTVVITNVTDSTLDKEMIDIANESSDGDKTMASVQDTTVRPNTFDKEMIDVSEESNDSCKEIVSVPDTAVILDRGSITSDKEMVKLSSQSNNWSKGDNTEIIDDCMTDFEENKLDENDDVVSHLSENVSTVQESCKTSDYELISEEVGDSKADVYTMVRTSVLRNLYLDIEDLCREKRKLLEDMEHLKKLQSDAVPSMKEKE